MSATPTPTCPRCGASVEASDEWGVFFECGAVTKRRNKLHQESDLCRERAAHAETRKELEEVKAARKKAEAELEKWLKWSDGQYPDDSVGTVIAAYEDGTVVLDDGITTWNPLRSLAFKESALSETRRKLEEATRCLDAVCVVQTNTTNRRQWVTYSGWLAPGDSLCEVTLPPKAADGEKSGAS